MVGKTARWWIGGAIILAAVLSVSWIATTGCGGGGSGSGSAVPSKSLSWDAPTQFQDGGALDDSADLATYEIYVNQTGVFHETDSPSAVISAVEGGSPVTTYNLANISPSLQAGTTYYISMRVVEVNGGRSGFSTPALQIVY